MRISDWSSDVCSSDLIDVERLNLGRDRLSRPGPRQRAIGVEQVRRDPGHRAKADDDQQRRRPDDEFELGRIDRKSVVEGRSVSVSVDLGGRRLIKNKNTTIILQQKVKVLATKK